MSDPGKRLEVDLVSRLCSQGIRVDPDQAANMEIFLDELVVWNRKINLTGVSSRQRMVDELLIDSILPIPFIPDHGTLLDVGSGGGFPAIPIKICRPGLLCHLVEPNARKSRFLKQVIRLTALQDIEVHEGRMEDIRTSLPGGGYDIITSRAFVPLPRFLTLCAPSLSPSGRMVAFLGNKSESSIREAADIMEGHQIFPFKRIPYVLPGKDSKREILILKKGG